MIMGARARNSNKRTYIYRYSQNQLQWLQTDVKVARMFITSINWISKGMSTMTWMEKDKVGGITEQ